MSTYAAILVLYISTLNASLVIPYSHKWLISLPLHLNSCNLLQLNVSRLDSFFKKIILLSFKSSRLPRLDS